MDCLTPPLEAPPEGTWWCPMCANAQASEVFEVKTEAQSLRDSQQAEGAPEMQIDPALQPSVEPEMDPTLMERGPSVATSSVLVEDIQSPHTPQKPRHTLRDKAGKFRPTAIMDSDEEIEVIDEPAVPSTSTRSRPSRVRTIRQRQSTEEEERASPPRAHKKLKVTVSAPKSIPKLPGPDRSKMLVRLKLPNKGKGKAREDEDNDEPQRSLFDDVLAPEDRDVMKTSVLKNDKDRFEKARLLSDVRLFTATF